jgi:hypothetical protein
MSGADLTIINETLTNDEEEIRSWVKVIRPSPSIRRNATVAMIALRPVPGSKQR